MNDVIEGDFTPLPRKQGESITMNFSDAIQAIIAGKKVARVSWGNDDYGFLHNEWLSINRDGKLHTWLVSQGDMEGNDWFILKDETN